MTDLQRTFGAKHGVVHAQRLAVLIHPSDSRAASGNAEYAAPRSRRFQRRSHYARPHSPEPASPEMPFGRPLPLATALSYFAEKSEA
jgi:hypothetical protein